MEVVHWCDRTKVLDLSIQFVIEYEVSTTDNPGELEGIHDQINKLTGIVGNLASMLTPEQQRELASGFFYYSPVQEDMG